MALVVGKPVSSSQRLQLGQYASSGHRGYCYTELSVNH